MTLQFPLARSLPKLPAIDLQAWKAEFQPDKLFPSAIAGLVTGAIGIIRAISYAALIFSGSLAECLNVGIGLAIFSSAAISIIVALTSSLPGAIATPLAAPTAVLAILAADLVATLPEGASVLEILPTVIAAIALGSLATGATLLVMGRLRMGNLLQFVPYPVIGGFMAGTGLLLVRGSFQVMAGAYLNFDTLAELCQPDRVSHWSVGLVAAVVLLLATKRWHHYLVMPGTLLVAIAAFYLGLAASGLPLAEAREAGWLLGPFPAGNLWQPLDASALGTLHWGAIARQTDTIGLLVFVSLVSLVMTNNGIEQAVGRDLDLNRELQAIGLANIAAGLGSSMAGNQALPSTLLVHKMGAPNRLAGVFKTIPCLGVLWLGAAFLEYFPQPILGSLLLFLGLDLLIRWLYQVRSSLSLVDYLTIPIVMVAINTIGFLPGIGVGFGLAVLAFLYRYSQLGAIAAETHPDDGTCVLTLQGYLFFGTTYPLLQRVREHLQAEAELRHITFDFAAVSGLDASAVQTFKRICTRARQQNVTTVFINLDPAFEEQLSAGGGLAEEIFPDLATSLQWCAQQS